MNAINKLLEKLAEKAELTNPYANIVFGSDPPENGICMIQNAGYQAETHLNKGIIYQMPVLLNGKHTDQQTLLDTLDDIHIALTKTNDYTDLNTDELQVYAIESTALPSIIGREQNNQWIAGSSLVVEYYWR